MKNTKLFTTRTCSFIAITLLLLSSCETSKNYVNEDKIEPVNYEKFTARTSIENFAPKFNYHIISDKEIEEPSEETLVALADIPGALDNDGGCGPDGCEIA